MGFIRDDFGRITVESRRESFRIHAGYGYRRRRVEIATLGLGDRFTHDGMDYRVIARLENFNGTFIEVLKGDNHAGSWAGDIIVESNVAEEKSDHPLGQVWRDHPHPEFTVDDLDDLIAALTDYRDSLP